MFIVSLFLDWGWQSVMSLLREARKFKFVGGKGIFKRRTTILVLHKVVIMMLESSLSATSCLIHSLLLMSGDVELNPGPGSWKEV